MIKKYRALRTVKRNAWVVFYENEHRYVATHADNVFCIEGQAEYEQARAIDDIGEPVEIVDLIVLEKSEVPSKEELIEFIASHEYAIAHDDDVDDLKKIIDFLRTLAEEVGEDEKETD